MRTSEIMQSRHHLVNAIHEADWPVDSEVIEMLATITDYLRKEDPQWVATELIGYRVHLDDCSWSNGVILGIDFTDPRFDTYHVHTFNTGEVETYQLGRNMEFSHGNIPHQV